MNLILDAKDDFTLSPYTGWTRNHWTELVEKMIIAIQPYVTEGKGGLALPNPVRWMDAFLADPEKMESFYRMEGYTRTRLLLSSWMVGTGKTELKVDGQNINIQDQYIEGLLSASDPNHPEYIGDRYDNNQWIAEISGVASAIYLARDYIWDKMNANEQQQILDWMVSTTGRKIPHNNWYLFLANTHLVLKALGGKYNREELDFCIKNVKAFDLGDGWFTDGDENRGHSIEQYNPWGFHYFLPAFYRMGGLDSETNDWIIDRLQKFITSYQRFFSANGSIPMWGRSWAYRPALTTPFIWGEIFGVSPISSGESRRLVSGQMKYYIENDYFNDDMTPTMGYIGENIDLIEPYSQYGSPYWGSAIFMNLVMQPDHDFWREKEKPHPVERESYCISEPEIGMLVAGDHKTGEVQVINHRAWHQKEGKGTKYAKKYTNFAYSSHFGIDLRRDENGYNCDNMIAVSPDGIKFSQRIIPNYIGLEPNYGASYYYPLSGFPFLEEGDSKTFSADKKIEVVEDQSVKITTKIFLKDFCQIRIHIIESEKELKLLKEGGFALNYQENFPEVITGPNAIGFFDGERGSFIKTLWGYSGTESIENLKMCVENSNTFGGLSVIPTLIGGKIDPGKSVFISLSGTWFGNPELIKERLTLVTKVIVEQDQIVLDFNDGQQKTFSY